MSEENKKDWERPWTTEEIVEHADNWNLACDAALLNTLKSFGDRILSKAEEVNDKIEDLNKDLSKIHLQVDLARNEFSSLRNTQFVECRVYEDDETIIPENPKDERENNVPQEETVEDFKEVVALGLEILDEFYDKVNVTVSDSEEDDEEAPSHVFRRKDPYINRRLPLVIGSEEWHKKWHVGLEETDSENENSSEKLSDSESEDDLSQNKDHSDVSSELSNLSGLNSSKVKPIVVSTANTTHQDYLASASGSDTSAEPTPRTLSFAEQLAAKLGNVIKESETPVQEPEVNRRPIQKKHSDFGALFSNEPPPLDDMKEKESHGIFSGGKGLFDDEDEDDLWNPGKSVTSSAKPFSTSVIKTQELDQAKGLFDEDSDDGIFAPKNDGIQQKKQPYLQSNKPAVPVFNEEPPLFEEDTNSKEKKKPTGGVSLFGKTDIFQGQNIGKILKQRKVSSSDDSNDEEAEFTPKPVTKSLVSNVVSPVVDTATKNTQDKNSNKQTISAVPQNKEKEKKRSTLFDDDIFGDDLFSSTGRESTSGLFKKSILFSDEDPIEPFMSRESSVNENSSKRDMKSETSKDIQSNDLLSPETPDTEYSFRKNSKSNIGGLFDDNRYEDDNIFMAKESKKTPKRGEISEKSRSETMSTKQKDSLFQEDLEDSDDLFATISKKKDDKKVEKPKNFLFDNEEDNDFNIFAPKSDNKHSENLDKGTSVVKTEKTSTKIEDLSEKKHSNKSTKPKISLFDDDLDDMNDLFSQFLKKDNIKEDVGRISDLFTDSSSSNPNKKTEESNAKREDEVKQHIIEKVPEELKEPEPMKKPITPPKSGITIAHVEKPVKNIDFRKNLPTEQKLDTHSDSTEKPITIQKSDIEDSSEKSVEEQKPLTTSVHTEKAEIISPKDFGIVSTEKSKIAEESVKVSNDNISTEDVKDIETPKRNEIIKTDEEKVSFVPKDLEEDIPKTVPKIPTIKEPENNEENVDLFAKPPEDTSAPETETEKYKNSPNFLNFMDSIPPPDDDWETYSDNTFDDMEPGNDGFQSRPSSLFDSEPPSLFFNDTSDIPKGPIDDRLFSSSSVSQNEPADVFSSGLFASDNKQEEKSENASNIRNNLDIGNNENLNIDVGKNESSITPKVGENSHKESKQELEEKESSKNAETNETVDKPTVSLKKPLFETEKDGNNPSNENMITKKPPIPEEKPDHNKSKTLSLFDTPPTLDFINEKPDSLFEEVPNEDQTDFLSSKEHQTNYDCDFKISENIISDKRIKKSVSFDNVEKNQIGTDEPSGTDSDDNMQSNISKITEKLQQISNKNEERTKPVVIPRKLSHNLNINVGALLPGSALPKRDRAQSPDDNEKLSKSLPASRFSLNDGFIPTKPKPIVRVSSEEIPSTKDYSLEKSVSFDGGINVEVLQSITKDRVRIPVRRRPSSRRARQKSLRDSFSDFRLDDPLPDEEMPSEGNESISFDNSDTKEIEPNLKLTVEPEEQKIIEKDNLTTDLSEKLSKEIHVLENESEDIFKTLEKDIKNVNKANTISIKKNEFFDDIKDELFGETSTLTKKIDSLFDDDDLFGNKSYASERKHESREIERNEKIDSKKNVIVTNEKIVENDFLQSTDNAKNDIIPTKDNLFDSSDEDDIFKSTKITAKGTKSEKDLKRKDDSTISIIGKIAGKSDKTHSKIEKSKPDSLFDFSDDDDFLENFASGNKEDKTKEKISSDKPKSNSLFDDMDDDDIFGTSSRENKTKQDVKPSVINKKPPKSTSLRKLENVEGVEDPLSALLK